MTKNAEVLKKICLVGSAAVGKTSLIRRLIQDVFDDKYLKTIGTKVSKKVITVENPEKDLKISLTMMVWDVMGQDGFIQLLQEAYFYGAGGCLAVCDSTRSETLEALEDWAAALFRVTGKVPLIFLANKSDLKENLEVDEHMLRSFAGRYNAPYLYTSAKTGDNVEQAFYEIGKLVTADIE